MKQNLPLEVAVEGTQPLLKALNRVQNYLETVRRIQRENEQKCYDKAMLSGLLDENAIQLLMKHKETEPIANYIKEHKQILDMLLEKDSETNALEKLECVLDSIDNALNQLSAIAEKLNKYNKKL